MSNSNKTSTYSFYKYSDQELIKAFNGQVGNRGWVGQKALYLHALRKEMIDRGWDISAVINESGGFNLNRHVQLQETTLVII